jgi:hypothetical protein
MFFTPRHAPGAEGSSCLMFSRRHDHCSTICSTCELQCCLRYVMGGQIVADGSDKIRKSTSLASNQFRTNGARAVGNRTSLAKG